jgi:hypothetical protein
MSQPIACTLRPREYAVRTTQLAELANGTLRSRTPLPGGERLAFAPGAQIERRLRHAIAAEAACCPFLRMELRSEPGVLVLDVTGPAEAMPVITALFA